MADSQLFLHAHSYPESNDMYFLIFLQVSATSHLLWNIYNISFQSYVKWPTTSGV